MIIGELFRSFWKYFKWGLLATVLTGLGVWLYVVRHAQEEIRRRAEAMLAERLPHLTVSIAAARLVAEEGIQLRGVRIAKPQASGESAELAAIDEIMIQCETSVSRLMQGGFRPRRCVLHRPVVSAVRRADGSWSLEELLKRGDTEWPEGLEVVIEEGLLDVHDVTAANRLRLQPLTCLIRRVADAQGWRVEASGQFASDHFRQVEFTVGCWPKTGVMHASAKVAGLELSSALWNVLPAAAVRSGELLHALRATADGELSLQHEPSQAKPWRFAASAVVRNGRYEHRSLPFPLSDLQARLRIDDQGLTLDEFAGHSRHTTLRLSARRQGWEAAAPLEIRVAGRQVAFDQRILEVLPPTAQEVWKQYWPEGEADVDATLVFDGRRWHPEATVTARNVAFTYVEVPYPLRRTMGVLTLRGTDVKFDLTAYARGVPVQLQGEVHDVGPAGAGEIRVRGEQLQIDADLVAALPAEMRTIIQRFRPTGTFDVDLRAAWKPHDPKIHQRLAVRLREATARYQGFPYGLANITGFIEQVDDDRWQFRDLRASNGPAQFTCQGTLAPLTAVQSVGASGGAPSPTVAAGASPGQELVLRIAGGKVALNEELWRAVPPAVQRHWAMLRPQGMVDLDLLLRYGTREDRTQLTVGVRPHGESVSLEPAVFPYRLEQIHGQAVYDEGVVTLLGLTARHGDTGWQSDGKAKLADDGSWSLQLTDLGIDRLHVDRDLLRAVPEKFRAILTELNPSGSFNLRGNLGFAHSGRLGDPLRTAWELDVVCHRNRLLTSPPLEDIFGIVHVRGESVGARVQARGRLALDSLTFRGLQFTEITGPLEIQPDLITFGSPREPQLEPGPRHVTAKFYDGRLGADAWLRRGGAAEPKGPAAAWTYSLRAHLDQANLGRLAREAYPGRQRISGKANVSLALNGSVDRPAQGGPPGGNPPTDGESALRNLQGIGSVRLRDANLYELPVMFALLKVLSLKEPDLSAFNTSDIEFRINGEHGQVYLPRIDLKGDALSLSGRGSLGFDKQLRLAFRPQLGRGGVQVPILSELVSGASSQVLEVYVSGTLDQPDVRREPLPDLKEAFERLQTLQPTLFPPLMPIPSTQRPGTLLPYR